NAACNRRRAIANLHFRFHVRADGRLEPIYRASDQAGAAQIVLLSNHHFFLRVIDVDDVRRLGRGEAQAPPLSDGDAMNTAVLTQHLARSIDEVTAAKL